MRRRRIALLCLSLSALVARTGQPNNCGRDESVLFLPGHDADGYFVRPHLREDPSVGYFPRVVSRNASYQGVSDYFAAQTGATVLYFGTLTTRDVGPGEWRGEDPLAALKTFAAAAGLKVETPQKDLWIVGIPEWVDKAAATVYAQPIDSTQQRQVSPAETAEIERALISQLPVRDARGEPRMHYLGVSYYWLAGEGRDMLLVQDNQAMEANRDSPSQRQTFKVHLKREGGKIAVECLWHTTNATGWLIPESSDDLDGDGYRDFVFGSASDYTPNVILSGKDGHVMLAFVGGLAVEKSASGPKRIAVQSTWQWGVDSVSSAGAMAADNDTPHGPYVLSFSVEKGGFVVAAGPAGDGRKAAVSASGSSSKDGRDLLAKVVGGSERVKVYTRVQPGGIKYTHEQVRSDVEIVRWSWPDYLQNGPELALKAGRLRPLAIYKSPGYLVIEEKRRQEPAKYR